MFCVDDWWACRWDFLQNGAGEAPGSSWQIVLVFVYYLTSLVGVAFAKSGKLSPFLGVWSANIIFTVVGVLLLQQLSRGGIALNIFFFDWPVAAWFVYAGDETTGRADAGDILPLDGADAGAGKVDAAYTVSPAAGRLRDAGVPGELFSRAVELCDPVCDLHVSLN